MLTLLDQHALEEIRLQADALNDALRGILRDVERRAEAFQPGEPTDDDEAELISMQGDSLADDYAVASYIVKDTLGVVMVLVHSHVEQGLKRLYKATRGGREIQGIRWDDILVAYQTVNIDVRSLPNYAAVDSVRLLSNAYKHSAGRLSKDTPKPNGKTIPSGTKVDYSRFDYPHIASLVIEFLRAVAKKATSPYAPNPSLKPKFEIEVREDGEHVFKRVCRRRFGGSQPDPWDTEVAFLICNGPKKKPTVATYPGQEGVFVHHGLTKGTKVIYWFHFVNSLGERSGRSEPHMVIQT